MERLWYKDTPYLSSFGVKVEVADIYMLDLKLYKFTDTCACSCKKANNEIPHAVVLFLQLILEKGVVGIANYIFKKRAVLNFNRLQTQFRAIDKVEILVDGLNTQVHCFGAELLDEMSFVKQEIRLAHSLVDSEELVNGIAICLDGVLSHITLYKMSFKLFDHN